MTLWQGPALALGTCAGIASAGSLSSAQRWTSLSTVAAVAVLGAYDDLVGTTETKGLGGHLGSLRRGQITSGAMKIAGMGLAGLAAGRVLRGDRGRWEQVVAGAVVAGSANLVNLLDLRPGRATKAVAIVAVPSQVGTGAGAALTMAPLAASLALLPGDLGERTMMGDAGSNAMGAALGCAAAAALGPRALVAVLAAEIALTLASEKVSFTSVIAATPVLREIDAFGRRRSP
ncbi:MAG: hypothetical protein WAN48_06115 [Actinomycetes bacterium]